MLRCFRKKLQTPNSKKMLNRAGFSHKLDRTVSSKIHGCKNTNVIARCHDLDFLVPALQTVDMASNNIQVLVISPDSATSVRLEQIANTLADPLHCPLHVRTYASTGKTLLRNDVDDIEKIQPHILFCTPGRLYDLLQKRKISVQKIRLLIVHQIHYHLDYGLRDILHSIIQYLLCNTQIVMCLTDGAQSSSSMLQFKKRNITDLRIQRSLSVNGLEAVVRQGIGELS